MSLLWINCNYTKSIKHHLVLHFDPFGRQQDLAQEARTSIISPSVSPLEDQHDLRLGGELEPLSLLTASMKGKNT